MNSKPPPKETCLQLSEFYYRINDHKRSWDWLMCWAAYDDWVELYWEKNA
jgi:hypothetical protein